MVIGFIGSKSDPCLWTKWDSKEENIIIIGIYVDNCLVIGKQKSISKLIEELKTYSFKLKIEEKVVDYLSYHFVDSERENKL
jgi:hypothetical protein